ncbi:MAG: ATP-binding cassette domain-containing protein [Fibrobacterota bacterium]
MTEYAVEVSGLTSAYGRAVALKDISFTLEKGKIHALIGKSGCGKTTLLKNLLGLMHYRSGSVKVLGVDMDDRDAIVKERIRERTGVLFQRGALLNSMSVGENVALPLEMHTAQPARDIEAEVRSKLGLVGLSYAYSKRPTELSGGMVKRAALARAMALNPEILFCDEPSAGLDPVTTKGIDELLLSLKDTFGMTVVLITHDLLSIQRIADRLLLIREQVIAFDGPATEAASNDHPVLREFFLKE